MLNLKALQIETLGMLCFLALQTEDIYAANTLGSHQLQPGVTQNRKATALPTYMY